jgi:hypothetical protein
MRVLVFSLDPVHRSHCTEQPRCTEPTSKFRVCALECCRAMDHDLAWTAQMLDRRF